MPSVCFSHLDPVLSIHLFLFHYFFLLKWFHLLLPGPLNKKWQVSLLKVDNPSCLVKENPGCSAKREVKDVAQPEAQVRSLIKA